MIARGHELITQVQWRGFPSMRCVFASFHLLSSLRSVTQDACVAKCEDMGWTIPQAILDIQQIETSDLATAVQEVPVPGTFCDS